MEPGVEQERGVGNRGRRAPQLTTGMYCQLRHGLMEGATSADLAVSAWPWPPLQSLEWMPDDPAAHCCRRRTIPSRPSPTRWRRCGSGRR